MRRWRAHLSGWLGVGVAATVLALPSEATAEPIFTGRGVSDSAQRSIDLVEDHLVFLQHQALRDSTLMYVDGTARWAPGRALLNDGQTVPANLSRTGLGFGGGFGRPSRVALFAGVTWDIIALSGPAFSGIRGFGAPAAGQALLFLGGAVYGVQVSYAARYSGMGGGDFGRDPAGNFQSRSAQEEGVDFRPGTPSEVRNEDAGGNREFDVLTVYDDHLGVFAAATWTNEWQYTGEPRRKLSEVRAHLQPLRLWARDFVETFGLPAAGVTRLDPLRDYYQEGDVYQEVASLEERAAEPEDEPAAEYEVDFGSDDVLAGGLRWRARGQVAPSVRFRRAEVGLVREVGLGKQALRVGARAHAVYRGDTIEPAGDAFVQLSSASTEMSVLGAQRASFALSYSYDSPDTTTFLPIPNAHVFGVQVLIGDPEASKPLIPLVRTVEKKHGATGSSGEVPP